MRKRGEISGFSFLEKEGKDNPYLYSPAELRALGARKVGIFGSFARGEETPESDVDVYLEFAEGMKTYDNFFAIHELLENLFGRPIDLVTDGSLSELSYHQLEPL